MTLFRNQYWAANVEGLIQLVQSVLSIAAAVEASCINGGVVLLLGGKSLFLQIRRVHKAEPRRIVTLPKLIDGKAVGRVIEKCFLIAKPPRCPLLHSRAARLAAVVSTSSPYSVCEPTINRKDWYGP